MHAQIVVNNNLCGREVHPIKMVMLSGQVKESHKVGCYKLIVRMNTILLKIS